MSRSERIQNEIQNGLQPRHLEVIDESASHSRGRETHYKVICVSDQFAGLNKVKRHQRVYSLLEGEMKKGLHAVTLALFTPEEWESEGGKVIDSPSCAHPRAK